MNPTHHPRRFATTLLLSVALAVPAGIAAQTQAAYPNTTIRMVVPFSPGGGTDILARLVATRMEASLKQPVVVENMPGANGALASEHVARRPADGYTLMFGSSSTHAITPLLSRKLNYVPFRDFAPVSVVAYTPLVLVNNSSSPIRDLRQFVAAAKGKNLSYGTFGLGSSPHILGEVLSATAGISLLHVPYKGSSPAVTDLLGNHIDSAFLTVAAVSDQIASGRLRPLAVSGSARTKSLPNVPTFKENGIEGMEDSGWFAIFVPTGTPAGITKTLAATVSEIVAAPDMQKRLIELGLDPVGSTPEQHAQIWKRTSDSVADVVKRTGIKLD